MMMYSLPMAFEGSSLQSRILGIGMLVLVCTKGRIMVIVTHLFQESVGLTIPDGCDFGIVGQSWWASVCERQPCHDPFGIISRE